MTPRIIFEQVAVEQQSIANFLHILYEIFIYVSVRSLLSSVQKL